MFDWDAANMAHIARHRVTPLEAEQALSIFPIDLLRQYDEGEDRFLQIGVTAALRVLVVITTWKGDLIRVISAYEAPASLRRRYWEERRETDGDV
jgi:uncharacterized DUF497 family protein